MKYFAYTVGRTEGYDCGGFKAKGGSVWPTLEQAELYLNVCDEKGNEIEGGVYLVELPNHLHECCDNKEYHYVLNVPAKIVWRVK